MRRLLLSLVSALALASAGCAHDPTMHINHSEISGLALGAVPPSLTLTVVLDVHNPNGYDVAVRAVRGQTVLAGQYPLPVYFQAPPEGVWLAAGQTTPVRVPINMPLTIAWALVQQSLASPTIPYRFTGKADVTASRTFKLEKDNYAVDEQGLLTRADMLAVVPASLFPH